MGDKPACTPSRLAVEVSLTQTTSSHSSCCQRQVYIQDQKTLMKQMAKAAMEESHGDYVDNTSPFTPYN